MIRALVTGELRADPQQRTTKHGDPFALARLSVPMGDQGRVNCSVIAFEPAAVARLLQLREGASCALAGVLKVGTFTTSDGTTRPSLDLLADEVAATTPRPRRPKTQQGARHAGDLPDADDWPEV